MSASSASELAAEVEALISSAADVSEEQMQRLMTAAVRLYAAKVDAGKRFSAVIPDTLTATDVVVTAASLLRSANVPLFEIAMFCGMHQ